MMLQHDVTSPRPYSRIHMVSGTKGFAQKYPRKGISLEPDGHSYISESALDSLLSEYEHPYSKRGGDEGKRGRRSRGDGFHYGLQAHTLPQKRTAA